MDLDATMQLIAEHEGFVGYAYQDTRGFWTVGYGRMIDGKAGGGISKEEARTMLKNDVLKAILDLNGRLPWWRELDDVRQAVMVSLCYNMGLGNGKTGLTGFVKTLQAIKAGRFADAAQGLLASKWAAQVKGRAKVLADMMHTGKWPG